MKVIKTSSISWQEWKDGFKCGKCGTLSEVTYYNVFGIRSQNYQGKFVWSPAYQCPKCDTINKIPYPDVPHTVKVRIPTHNNWKTKDPLPLPKVHDESKEEES